MFYTFFLFFTLPGTCSVCTCLNITWTTLLWIYVELIFSKNAEKINAYKLQLVVSFTPDSHTMYGAIEQTLFAWLIHQQHATILWTTNAYSFKAWFHTALFCSQHTASGTYTHCKKFSDKLERAEMQTSILISINHTKLECRSNWSLIHKVMYC